MSLFTSDELSHYADGVKKLFHNLMPPETTGRPARSRNYEKIIDKHSDYDLVHKTREKGCVVS